MVVKAVLSISKVPFNLVRDSVATRVNELVYIEIVPANTPKFTHDPVTLAPLGLLIEHEAKNLIAISNLTLWSKLRVTVFESSSIFGDPVYILQGSGTSGQHSILTPYPTVNFDTYRTLSIYMKKRYK
jgi:hypothetical protein